MIIPPQTKIVDLNGQHKKVYSGQQINLMIWAVTCWANSLALPAQSQIGIIGRNSAHYVAVLLGLRNSNHISVPINYKLTKKQIEHCVQHCSIILCDDEFLDLLPTTIAVQNLQQTFVGVPSADTLDPNRTSLILYTSGSTGNPRPVSLSYQDIVRTTPVQVDNGNLKILSCNPFFHLAGINWLNQNLFAGNHLFVLPQFDPAVVLSTISKYKIDAINMVTPMVLKLLDQLNIDINLESIKSIMLPSAPVTEKDLIRIKNTFCNATQILNYYGLTETGAPVFSHHSAIKTPAGSVGQAQTFTVKIINGILHIKTSELLSDQKNINEEWFNTGDQFRVDADGFYYYLGRADDMFKVNGEKVYPHEIETVLSAYPGVNQVCVLGVDDPLTGSKPVAFVQMSNTGNSVQLVEYAQQNLSTYQVPRKIVIVDQFPMTGSGKINRAQLLL
jgi:acyl-CoA synthetase (AMP-forming)/AMP-acid ligase II